MLRISWRCPAAIPIPEYSRLNLEWYYHAADKTGGGYYPQPAALPVPGDVKAHRNWKRDIFSIQLLNIKNLAAAGAGVGSGIATIGTIKKSPPMSVGEKIPNPYAGTAGAETLLHDKLLCI